MVYLGPHDLPDPLPRYPVYVEEQTISLDQLIELEVHTGPVHYEDVEIARFGGLVPGPTAEEPHGGHRLLPS